MRTRDEDIIGKKELENILEERWTNEEVRISKRGIEHAKLPKDTSAGSILQFKKSVN